MTDATEPDEKTPSATAADQPPNASGESPIRKSRWSALNRTNQIAAVALSAVAAVFLAAAIFCAGLLVGAEFGGFGEHHHDFETSDHRDGGDDASGENEGDDASDNQSDGEYDGESTDQGGQPDSPQRPQIPSTPVPATPRP